MVREDSMAKDKHVVVAKEPVETEEGARGSILWHHQNKVCGSGGGAV